MAQLNLKNGSAGKRLGAKLLDGIPAALISGIAVVLALPLIGYEQISADTAVLDLGMFYVVSGIGSVVALGYWIFLWGWEAKTGKTLGNLMLGLRTTNEEGFAPGWLAVFLRNLIIGLSGIVPVIGFVLMMVSNLFDSPEQRQGWYDKAARTLVFDVRAGRNPLVTGGIGGPASFAPQPAPPAVRAIPSPVTGHGTTGPEEAPTSSPQETSAFASSESLQRVEHGQRAQPSRASEPASVSFAPPAPADPTAAPAPPAATPPEAAPPAAALLPEKIPTGRTAPLPENEPTHPDQESEETVVTRRSGERGIRIQLDDGRDVLLRSTALIGRNPAGTDCVELISVKDEGRSVSKTHLHLRVDDGRLWVTDRNSTNGSAITAKAGARIPLRGGEPYLAEPDSTVHFGDRSFRVEKS
ncbi:putative RDD family membrane protein YckC [Arthrobacter pigmenti]|uniref:Putative RDD family membrane protein YckC n=1 Tax=Arthrobacter pigmenti TaxID=271432 RepID=A0A846RRY4_9MICC|nr:RDD family protein [Arthrobacter pigmenti]NJC21826.1 putative RDD family membrane protein YckC [Arthrobacter pigmenti]